MRILDMKANGLLLFTLLLAACDRQEAPTPAPAEQPAASQSRAAPPVAVSSAQRFWSTFREAALGQDLSALQPMTRFPFVTRGATDDDPSVANDAAAFAELLPRILAQDVGLSAEPETVRQYIERHPELPTIATGAGQSTPVAADATQFFAGPLGFEKVGEQWYWVSASLEE
jgi:hypothetical protein